MAGGRTHVTAALLAIATLASSPLLQARERSCRGCEPPDTDDDGGLYDGEGFGGRIPFGWDDREGPPASDNPPYPQGFVLTYSVRHAAAVPRDRRQIQRYAEVGQALAACWSAAAITNEDWNALTLRLSFKRDGSINGVPVVRTLEAPGDATALSRLRGMALSTLAGCAPLPFSSSLGAAIAGQIFSIRFINAKDT